MAESGFTPTRAMFDTLGKLYKQGQLLLNDADVIMGEHNWETKTNVVFEGISYSLNSPDKWFVHWAGRFYLPVKIEEEDPVVQRIPFISVHFAPDQDTKLDEPIASAGWLNYLSPMHLKEAEKSYRYWMCKYWFWGKPHDSVKNWRQTGPSEREKRLKGTETFIVPLYSITSSEKLSELVVRPLLDRYPPIIKT